MFSFSILKSPLRFSDVEVIAILETCFVNDLRSLGTIYVIFACKEFKDLVQSLVSTLNRAQQLLANIRSISSAPPPIVASEFTLRLQSGYSQE